MATDAVLKAHILSTAIPYLQEYRGKVVVVKYGG
ncbi:MAG TPA: acetylglutamate kinase, partial [Erysipelotrichaceae bacterium]|nr:acetylglutamate kinase [Erysipelotrichaceae bacterium]